MNYERANIRDMTGYASGEQPAQPDIIKLNTNENPYPASAAVAAALQACRVEDLRRYPSPLADRFRQTAADYHQLDIDNIIPTNGGDELLRLVITTFADAGDTLAIAEPGYSLYPVLADIQGCRTVRIPLAEDWSLPSDFAEQAEQAGARLLFLVNPHAPSGHLNSSAELSRIAETFSGILLIDEAYVDFIDPELRYDTVELTRKFDNVLILRTMSKGYSLAGLRFAYGIGAKSLLAPMLYKTRDSYNTDFISQALATAALQDRAAAALTWGKVRVERARLHRELSELGFYCTASQSNFILAQVQQHTDSDPGDEQRALWLYQQLKNRGILVRYFDQPRLRDKLRITVGTPEQNTQLLRTLALLSDQNTDPA
jgi:histidinol-phosphate aminotransferase